MKTFSAESFNKSPGEVYREADRSGSAKINHAHYPDRMFILSSRERGTNSESDDVLSNLEAHRIYNKHLMDIATMKKEVNFTQKQPDESET